MNHSSVFSRPGKRRAESHALPNARDLNLYSFHHNSPNDAIGSRLVTVCPAGLLASGEIVPAATRLSIVNPVVGITPNLIC